MQHEKIGCPGLPLAVYREIAAHLRQVPAVEVRLLPQTASEFDYAQSQVEALWIGYPTPLSDRDRAQLEEILDYYAQHHGPWQRKTYRD